jgi:hypothetical protein
VCHLCPMYGTGSGTRVMDAYRIGGCKKRMFGKMTCHTSCCGSDRPSQGSLVPSWRPQTWRKGPEWPQEDICSLKASPVPPKDSVFHIRGRFSFALSSTVR